MTALRLISLPAHAAFEFATGVATMAAPFMFGFGTAGTIIAVVIGSLVVGLALAAAVDERDALPIATHFAFDRGLVIGLAFAAVALALAGDPPAAAFLAVVAAVQLGLSAVTRYSVPRA